LKDIFFPSKVKVSSSGEVKVIHVHEVPPHPIDLNVTDHPSKYNLRDLSVAVGCHAKNEVLNQTLVDGVLVSDTRIYGHSTAHGQLNDLLEKSA